MVLTIIYQINKMFLYAVLVRVYYRVEYFNKQQELEKYKHCIIIVRIRAKSQYTTH